MQVRQIDLSVVVHKHTDIDTHVGRGLYIAQGRILRMCVHQPDADRYVIGITFVVDRNCAL